ncbi:Alpha/Beta hydrolase protein [Calycina marina]|uniref:Carboxypeptidase n=1 Tax=Calycina marina TaxID=1763456 RepID=A0A9P7Z265_9HELO|nr:Alpha/Beta hydrolase protein [Calycina marina]
MSSFLFLLFFAFSFAVLAQYPPASNLTIVTSPADSSITISYKSPPAGTCKTIFESQKQYTGWVHMPGNYSTNTFFWFIEARQPTTELTIWLNGGPGSSSMLGLFAENGPCEVIEVANGQFGTQARDWGWDRASNVLYIDQPNQVGFSYDTPTNCSLDLLTDSLYTPEQSPPASQPSMTFLNGTFSSLNKYNTANTSETSGMAIWHMLQGFLSSFPQYSPASNSSMGVHLFAESYGGKYGPVFATVWEQQNKLRLNGTLPNSTIDINLESVGIINGCVDDLIQGPYYPGMTQNNTFGLTAINPTRAQLALDSFSTSGGCKDLITQCRAAVAAQDPTNGGDVSSVNTLCASAYTICTDKVIAPYNDAGRSIYDIGHFLPDSFPPSTYLELLNTASFQEAIGSPVNFTTTNWQIVQAFTDTGDYERQTLVPDIAALLNAGIRVGFIYGDRDYICNWLGGEAISLAVAAQTSPSYASHFPAAGYAPIIVNTTYIGGVVRQYGNLSFSRIYDAGHSVPAYQGETAFQVFARIIMGTAVGSGQLIDISNFNTTGPLNATHTNTLPESPEATCYLRDIPESCTNDQKNMIINGQGVIINGVLYSSAADWEALTSVVPTKTITMSTGSVSVIMTTEAQTGLFTATVTPTGTEKNGGLSSFDFDCRLFLLSLLAIFASSNT